MEYKTTQTAIDLIIRERARQIEKTGIKRNSYGKWLMTLTDRIGKLSHEVMTGDSDNAYIEMKKTAALAVQMLERFVIATDDPAEEHLLMGD